MKFYDLVTKKDFLNLSAGDIVIVQWNHQRLQVFSKSIQCFSLPERPIINNSQELLLSKKGNIYINIDLFLIQESLAKQVFLVKEDVH